MFKGTFHQARMMQQFLIGALQQKIMAHYMLYQLITQE
jgi:hypothetical protein